MTTDNAKPAVITAAEFVAGGYAERIAAGECVVFDHADDIVVEVNPVAGRYTYKHKFAGHLMQCDIRPQGFYVRWLPVAASSTDADEVARLRAEVARLREAVQGVITNTSAFRTDLPTSGAQAIFMIRVINERLTAALETGEAQS